MYIGVDLGGTAVKIGLVDSTGCLINSCEIPTGVGRAHMDIIKDIIGGIEKTIKEGRVDLSQIQSIGIGIPGLAESKTGRVIYCTNLNWKDIPLGEILRKHFNKNVYVENDATVAALAESLFGSTKDVENSMFLTIGTGIGGGILIGGKIYSGSHGAGSEAGHMVVGENFYNCNCGRNGCLETFASATAMTRYVEHRLSSTNEASVLRERELSARNIFDAAKAGDALAMETVNRMVKYLSIGIANIYNLLDPDVIALGGGVSKAGDYLLELLNKSIAGQLLSSDISYGKIVIAELGNEAGILGAAFLGNYI